MAWSMGSSQEPPSKMPPLYLQQAVQGLDPACWILFTQHWIYQSENKGYAGNRLHSTEASAGEGFRRTRARP